ncbi:hypothetical protein NOF04DRAFT_1343986 [Fusarium oxysporum II5]|nr:hypothetical protein NOF04DRAFT_1343986 [Fusarium oxysporum II5]
MLVLVAGATGNLGQKLIDSLYSRGHQVRARRDKLECFVQSEPYYDVPAIESACKVVDAVICAYTGMPESSLDGQLLLFRAVEREGIKKYVAASWNFDWKNMNLGVHESPANKGAWDPKRKAMGIWGTAEFTVAVIGRDYASEGGIDIAKTYGQVRNCHVDIRKRGGGEELDNDKLYVKTTSLEEFLRQYPQL